MTDDDLRVGITQMVEREPIGNGETPSSMLARVSPRVIWRLALGLLIVSGAAGWIACALPWATARVSILIGPRTAIILTEGITDPALAVLSALLPSLRRHPTLVEPIFVVLWFLYLVLGLVVALLLFTRHRPRMRVALLLTYALWLATLGAPLLFVSVALATDQGASLTRQAQMGGLLVSGPASATGLWCGWAAVLLGSVGLFFARDAIRRGLPAESLVAPAAPRAGAELASAGLATAGVVIWETGFFALPWATQGCSGLHFSLNHFLIGTCSGLDSADMLARWSMTSGGANLIGSGDNPLAPVANILTDLTLLSMLLAVVTLWAVARLWIGPRGARRYGWLLACLTTSSLIALAAWQGAADALARPSNLFYGAPMPWVYGPGVLVTCVGLALAALGLVGALTSRWRGWRHARRR